MSTPPPIDPSSVSDEDAYVDRLRAVDPATGATSDLTALRAAVAARADETAGAAAAPDGLAAHRRSRFGWPARVAAAAAAVLVVGSGGYALGNGRASTAEVQGAAPVISLNGGGSDSGLGSSSAAEPAPSGAESLAGAQDSARSLGGYGGGWGRTIFTESGLSDAAVRAEAWALDPSSTFSEATAAAAAKALGMSGTPTLRDGAWQVGATDGSGPSLGLSPDGQGTLSYYDPSVDPWGCIARDAATSSPDEPEDPAAPLEQQECLERDLGPAPGTDAAKARLGEVLAALGIDASTYEMVAEDYGDARWSYITGYQVVDGQRTGVTWSASLTGAGLSSLYGSTAELVSLGEYDVVSPAEAVARLGDPRFGASGGYPYIADDTAGVLENGGSTAVQPTPDVPELAESTLPIAPGVGSSFSWPVQEIQITSARLGVAMNWQSDGAVVLVPTYELAGADGSTWSVIAVADDALDFATVG